ncbi:methyltransferase [Actinokineospora auranticolor]|uniref:Methyltransferase family protein n=1 Tax=Actinokineospora auranticolor TaxID=155976 RepID=A0A2S6GYW7_9PSEU|nr:methyltransferase [Actinokineospora auranticolor]PPK70429.1 methyltransferase family protein [Actinokineospora auranticolor]
MLGTHYFDEAPSSGSDRKSIPLTLPDLSLELTTDVGVFSRDHLDTGTRVLLEHAPPPPVRGPILDLGCGYGPIALTWATRRKRLEVWATDVNTRALELTRLNAEAAGRGNVQVGTPDEVPADVRFAAIYSNPPIRVGKSVLHDMLRHWLPRLLPDGAAFLVVQRNLGADSLAKWLIGEGFPTTRRNSTKGFRILEVRPRPEVAAESGGA